MFDKLKFYEPFVVAKADPATPKIVRHGRVANAEDSFLAADAQSF